MQCNMIMHASNFMTVANNLWFRSHDIRFASDSRSKEIQQKSVPHAVRRDVERIATSVERK